MKGSTMLYRPVSLVVSVASGVLAGMLFKRVWRAVAGEDEAPSAISEEYGWGEVIAAAALQGAITAAVKAAMDRGGAAGIRRLTGSWPD